MFVRLCSALAASVLLCSAPAFAAKINASLIPDGNYTITVEKVVDASHIAARMDNGVEVDLKAAKATVVFSNTTPPRIKVFMVQGEVVFFAKA